MYTFTFSAYFIALTRTFSTMLEYVSLEWTCFAADLMGKVFGHSLLSNSSHKYFVDVVFQVEEVSVF